MRIGKVVGKVSFAKVHPTFTGKRWVIATPLNLAGLSGLEAPTADEIIVIDELGAAEGDLIGIAEGGEAPFPYYPKMKPLDAYNACILDHVHLDDAEVLRLIDR